MEKGGSVGRHSVEPSRKRREEKILITGDDVLIEYVDRLINTIKPLDESMLLKNHQTWRNSLERFITHYVWHTNDVRRNGSNKVWSRLESRLIEMKDRRRRLIRSLYKKEGNLANFDRDFAKQER